MPYLFGEEGTRQERAWFVRFEVMLLHDIISTADWFITATYFFIGIHQDTIQNSNLSSVWKYALLMIHCVYLCALCQDILCSCNTEAQNFSCNFIWY